MDVQLMTFNLRLHVQADGPNAWPHRVRAVQRVIEESDASVIGTQELLPGMLTDLMHVLPDYSLLGLPRQPEDEHCALLYRRDQFHVLQSGTFWLSRTPDVPGSKDWESSLPRICTWAEFQATWDAGTRLSVWNIHLDHQSERARVNGLRVVLEHVRDAVRTGTSNYAIMGDFNDGPASEALQGMRPPLSPPGLPLTNLYETDAGRKVFGPTFHGFDGGEEGEPIDYLFVSPSMDVIDAQVVRGKVDGRYPSDHYPVMARVRLHP